jgi:acetyl esterase/lipase
MTLATVRSARRAKMIPAELRSSALMAYPTISSASAALIKKAMSLAPAAEAPAGVKTSEHFVPAEGRRPQVRVVTMKRSGPTGEKPALLWMHGGGYVLGAVEKDFAFVSRVLDRLDIVIVSVDYRLAPAHPFPAALDDCHATLSWLVEHAATIGIDNKRIAIGGQSAGGGLAAALVQRVADTGQVFPVFQMLIYPMLDAMTTARRDHGDRGQFVWTPKSNLFGWKSYLGRDPKSGGHPEYAVPAHRASLENLPPAWIGVGTLDLFHDEDLKYADRLRKAGVDCITHVTEGGYHAFDVTKPEADATTAFYDSMLTTLAERLGLGDIGG